MHSLIASVDFNDQNICYYSHNYGAPRTFNEAGAIWYNARFNGEAGERAIANNDQFTEFIPAGPNYTHAGTMFYYWGRNITGGHMNWNICWDAYDDPACAPRPGMSGFDSTPEQDHYFYFANVGSCGGKDYMDLDVIDQFLESPSANSTIPFVYTTSSPSPTPTPTRYRSSSSRSRSSSSSSYSSRSSSRSSSSRTTTTAYKRFARDTN